MKPFILNTQHTSYLFNCLPSGHLEHLYYGPKIDVEEITFLSEKMPFPSGLLYSKANPISLEDIPLEFSTLYKGDLREPLIEIEAADGCPICDFVYVNHKEITGKTSLLQLPSSFGADFSVGIELEDKAAELTLFLTYSVFSETDVIVRSSRLRNNSSTDVRVRRLMSAQLDFSDHDYIMRTFDGHWARERTAHEKPVVSGIMINDSKAGISSNRHNPLVIFRRPECDDRTGECFALNLIYSGNHCTAVEVNSYEKMHIVSGLNPSGFSMTLKPGESMESPESVLCYSDEGLNVLSQRMHRFINQHIISLNWQNKARPILINSWEATYFRFNQSKLLKLAKEAKNVGIELFVLDDGWFGKRNNDTMGLGDWNVNLKKLPNGIAGLSEKIHELGMQFGLWVEPEMVNPDSDLFRSHPEWAVQVKGCNPSIGRNQLILDLSLIDVQDFLIETMSRVFSDGKIDYIKWDFNRIFSDPRDTSQQFLYMRGLYRVLDVLTKSFPHILFESCASGGNRFDLGMLAYMPQTWTSDNTDALSRTVIQDSTSQGYPLSTMAAHVSSVPNHQTQRITPLETRFQVACFGLLGYELNFSELGAAELKVIAAQVSFYKEYRELFQFGTFYRLSLNRQTNLVDWMVVSADRKQAILMHFQDRAVANPTTQTIRTQGLDPHQLYELINRTFAIDLHDFGDLINQVSPIHIKKDSLVHDVVSKFMPLKTEVEHEFVYGNAMNLAGMKLKQSNVGGLNDELRIFGDTASRLYIFKAVEKDEIKMKHES